ncbi:MAG TPA: SDR family NAD(P)-dependent oxidoreductase [Bryobacteraceae bacterium]|nr:SDR family NAD(P)-dependent oxidoreductase [Bryobacteraceae bacterium]
MGRVLLITGSTGIAEATALAAARQGDSVFVISRNETHCRDLSAKIPGSGYYACDLREERAAGRAVEACLEKFHSVDAVFNVAGISGRSFGDGPVHECTADGWDVTLDTNARSMFLVCREALKHWLGGGRGGTILNMSSVLAFSPEAKHFGTHAYAASKGAIIAMSLAMAAYYAPHQIRVNVIAPGLVRTPMSARAQSDNAVLAFMAHKQPLSQGLVEASDVAEAALFLLGEKSRHITGQVVSVDGGWTVSG